LQKSLENFHIIIKDTQKLYPKQNTLFSIYDLNKMTLLYGLNLDILKMYGHANKKMKCKL